MKPKKKVRSDSENVPMQTRRIETKKKAAKKTDVREVVIAAPNFQYVEFKIRGTAPLVMHKFSTKARLAMMEKMSTKKTPGKKKVREIRDYDEEMREASNFIDKKKGIYGIPAMAFVNSMVSACRITGAVMTRAKLSLFVIADAYVDGTGLVKITKGKPRRDERAARLPNNSFDIRIRPMWDAGWESVVKIRYDGDQFGLSDITALMMRAGMQVGILEGRPGSKNSAGLGWGTFEIVE